VNYRPVLEFNSAQAFLILNSYLILTALSIPNSFGFFLCHQGPLFLEFTFLKWQKTWCQNDCRYSNARVLPQ